MPKSIAATVNSFSPIAGTIYFFSVETSADSCEPLISGDLRTSFTISSLDKSIFEKIPTLITPHSRRWRVIALVSTLQIPTIPCATRSSSNERCARQFETIGDGSLTTNPETQILRDSSSVLFIPVLPICGAVIITT